MNFQSFQFSPKLERTIAEAGYTTPTPIQQKAIPEVLAGRDVIGLAQTGTGKTAAFVLPLLQCLISFREAVPQVEANQRKTRRKPQALILAPTRELAEQINEVIRQLGRGTGVRSMVIFGGVSQRGQVDRLEEGVDIIVACPGRLIDLYEQRFVDLSGIHFLVLDEADQMFDMGFFPSLRRILSWLPKSRQSLFFSATMPKEIAGLAEEALNKPVRISTSNGAPVETVSHAIFPVAAAKKADLLFAILPKIGDGSVLIFTRTKHRAKRLGQQLDRLGYRATSLQGNLSHNRRKEAMDGFRNGGYQIMVATDIAARGIDISSVTHVINFDIPETPEAYTHRIGRTGRAARTGDALTLVTEEDLSMVRAIERRLGKPIERQTFPGFDHTLPASSEQSEFNRGERAPRGGRRGGGQQGRGFRGDSRRADRPAADHRRGHGSGHQASGAPRGNGERRSAAHGGGSSFRPSADRA